MAARVETETVGETSGPDGRERTATKEGMTNGGGGKGDYQVGESGGASPTIGSIVEEEAWQAFVLIPKG